MADYTTYSQAWLEDPTSIKIVLAIITAYDVVAQSEVSFYFSTSGYITQDSSISFNPVISGQVSVTEKISNNGSASLSYGDLELCNPQGDLDAYLDSSKYIWKNRNCELYYGDPRWVSTSLVDLKTKFSNIFNGIISDIDSRDAYSINFMLRDKLERLNTPVSETKLGSYGVWADSEQNKDTLIPIVIGEVFNASPLLIDPSTLEYQVHNGSIEQVTEIRDNDVPIYTYNDSTLGATVVNATGKFKLTYPAYGQITCSLQGDNRSIDLASTPPTGVLSNTYANTIANAIGILVTQYGKASTRLSISDIDLDSFKRFNTNNSEPIGIVISNRENTIQVCNDLAASKGAQLIFSRQGKLQLIQYGSGTLASEDPRITIQSIDSSDIMLNSFSISSKLELLSSIKLGYAKNWTVQDAVDRAIPEDHKDAYKTEWLTYTATDASIAALYKNTIEPVQQDTYLVRYSSSVPSQQDARVEAERRLTLYKTQRFIYKMKCNSKMLSLVLGQQVTLVYPRFGLQTGKVGQVVGLVPNWTTEQIEVEVLI